MGLMTLLRIGVVGALAAAAAACTVTTDDPSYVDQGGGSPPDYCANCTFEGGTTAATTLLATVEPNVTMTAQPGQGVGVFTEYDKGGHWHVWWTCDTALSGDLCAFDVKVSLATGSITHASADHFGTGDVLTSPSMSEPGSLDAQTTTTLSTEGIYFDTDPGATITLTATIGGVLSGQFLFWIENGKIDDGYSGPVSDPLMLKGASP
jgi:hypothetical protein